MRSASIICLGKRSLAQGIGAGVWAAAPTLLLLLPPLLRAFCSLLSLFPVFSTWTSGHIDPKRDQDLEGVQLRNCMRDQITFDYQV